MKFYLLEQINTEREDRKAHEKKLEEKISKVNDKLKPPLFDQNTPKVKEKAKLQHQNGHDHDDPESRCSKLLIATGKATDNAERERFSLTIMVHDFYSELSP